jgi:hypothetical protein
VSYTENKVEYLNLMRRFARGDVEACSFCFTYMTLWRADREEEWSKIQAVGEADAMSSNSTHRTGVSTSEGQRYPTSPLLETGNNERFLSALNSVFTACDAYEAEPEEPYEIGEEQLRNEIAVILERVDRG